MNNKYKKAKDILIKYNQSQVIEFIDKANEETKQKLIEQVLKIDFDEIKELYEKTFEELYVDLEELQPITGINPDRLDSKKLEEYKEIGIKVIKSNKFAVATMAGGQGTRLRTSKSKGNI